MITIVLPWAMRSMLALTSASLSGSSALVASSSNKNSRIGNQRSGNRQALPLSAGEVG